jgi:hypothetical protein
MYNKREVAGEAERRREFINFKTNKKKSSPARNTRMENRKSPRLPRKEEESLRPGMRSKSFLNL